MKFDSFTNDPFVQFQTQKKEFPKTEIEKKEIRIGKISDKAKSYVNMLILGESGTGKTHFASTYNHEKTLYVNVLAESGSMTLRAKNIDLDCVDVTTYEDMLAVIEYIRNNKEKYELVFIDSLSQWQKTLEKEIPVKMTKNGQVDEFYKWARIKEITKEVIDCFKQLPIHFVATCEIIKDKDEETGSILYVPSLAGSSKHEITYFFDEVYYFTRFQNDLKSPIQYKALTASTMKYPCKTRLSMPMQIDNPSLKEILEKLK